MHQRKSCLLGLQRPARSWRGQLSQTGWILSFLTRFIRLRETHEWGPPFRAYGGMVVKCRRCGWTKFGSTKLKNPDDRDCDLKLVEGVMRA